MNDFLRPKKTPYKEIVSLEQIKNVNPRKDGGVFENLVAFS